MDDETDLRSKRQFWTEGGASPPLRQGSSVIVLLNANWYETGGLIFVDALSNVAYAKSCKHMPLALERGLAELATEI